MKINKINKETAIFVLEDDNEIMQSALTDDSELDNENKEMNRQLIKQHNKIINKLQNNLDLTKKDLQLICDANEIHVNDVINISGHHTKAMLLQKYYKSLLKRRENESS